MEKSTLKLKPDFIGKAWYEKLGNAPRRIDGEAIFFEDRALNGNSVAPALNVRATGLKLAGGK
ncbi:TPA: hypothetical protein VCN61_001563 [Streptococcus pyogenes]|nr:hypothetical protein [Streptococcus pyogenes]HEP2889451.1 hypothetical protein [Streptococcus pyogenes]HEP3246625.1 hypothetical protein [Streptococcus pyogenes]HEP3530634.1 hypothetical protein [Streptococcus pyogenes]HEP3720796.1 hypothetical protein [Streptococcus pyogenes]